MTKVHFDKHGCLKFLEFMFALIDYFALFLSITFITQMLKCEISRNVIPTWLLIAENSPKNRDSAIITIIY